MSRGHPSKVDTASGIRKRSHRTSAGSHQVLRNNTQINMYNYTGGICYKRPFGPHRLLMWSLRFPSGLQFDTAATRFSSNGNKSTILLGHDVPPNGDIATHLAQMYRHITPGPAAPTALARTRCSLGPFTWDSCKYYHVALRLAGLNGCP